MFKKQKLWFQICGEATRDRITLSEALAGAVGTVYLGKDNIELWSPTNPLSARAKEAICDMRYVPISDSVYDGFLNATKGMFLPAHVVLFKGNEPNKIQQALTKFNFVLVPDSSIKNLPKDFRNKVLSYK